MSFPERATADVMAYIRICKINSWEPEIHQIEGIIKYHTLEEAHFRIYGFYPENPMI